MTTFVIAFTASSALAYVVPLLESLALSAFCFATAAARFPWSAFSCY
jgi:hypothetical protein